MSRIFSLFKPGQRRRRVRTYRTAQRQPTPRERPREPGPFVLLIGEQVGETAELQKAAPRQYQKLTIVEHTMICRMADQKLSNSEIARRLNIDKRRVAKALQYRGVSALDVLKNNEVLAAQAWVRSIGPSSAKGDHRASRDLLLHTKAIEPIKSTESTGITIVFGIGQLAGTSQTLDHSERQIPNVLDVQAQNVNEK